MTSEPEGVVQRQVRLTVPGGRREVESLLIALRGLAARRGLTIEGIQVAADDDESRRSRRPRRTRRASAT